MSRSPSVSGPDYAEMMARYLGRAVMEAFEDDDVAEVYVNPHDGRVRVDTHTRGRLDTGATIATERLEMFLNTVATAHGLVIGPISPTLQAELPATRFGGARLQGFVPPAASGVAVVIRKLPRQLVPLDSYVASGALPATWCDLLRQAVRDHLTIVIAGGTGTGKSTLLGSLLLEISIECPGERLVLLEDTVELTCPVGDHMALRTTPDLPLAALVKATLRASPTRIVIGEVRDQAALDFLDAAVTGHPGGLCTVHAASAMGALARLDRLAQRANVPPQPALVAEAVDLVVVLQGTGAARRVADLTRLSGLTPDGRYALHHSTETGTWTA